MLESETPAKKPEPTTTESTETATQQTQPQQTATQQTQPQQTAPQQPTQPGQAPTTSKSTFTQTFKKGQYHAQVKDLQTYLTNWGFYKGAINGIYDRATIEAVYQFQLKNGVITGKEKNKSGYGRFGPQTRAKINSMI